MKNSRCYFDIEHICSRCEPGNPCEQYNCIAYIENQEKDSSIEEELKSYFQGQWPGMETPEQCNTDLHFTPPAIMRLAIHFAEWGISQGKDGDVVTYNGKKYTLTEVKR